MTLKAAPFDARLMAVTQAYGAHGQGDEGSAVWETYSFADLARGLIRGHNGVDVPLPDGTQLHAPLDGVAHLHWSWTIPGKPTGWALSIDHSDGSETLFGHVSRMLVAEGQRVHAGDPVAVSGGVYGEAGAGFSTGAHVHIERHSWPSGPTFDPLPELLQVLGASHAAPDDDDMRDPQHIAAHVKEAYFVAAIAEALRTGKPINETSAWADTQDPKGYQVQVDAVAAGKVDIHTVVNNIIQGVAPDVHP